MKRILRILGGLLLAVTLIAWAYLGANTGWTKTSVAIEQIDPITEIEYVTYEDRFVPGVEFLAVGVGVSISLFLLSLVIRKPASPALS